MTWVHGWCHGISRLPGCGGRPVPSDVAERYVCAWEPTPSEHI
jgi:hypothetical protein